jgi:RND family efflux transporter MFP subunit
MRKQMTWIVLAGLSLIALSCGRDSEANGTPPAAVTTKTETIQRTTVADYFQAPGTIKARTSTVLSSTISGQVLSVAVREGDRVRRSQLVVQIDDRDPSAQLHRALAALAEAQRASDEAERGIMAGDAAVRAAETHRDLAASTRKRYDVLRERKSVSPQEYDEVESRYKSALLDLERSQQTLAAAKARREQVLARIDQAKAGIEAAQVVLGYTRVTSPIDGIVTVRRIEPGMLAAPGTPLLAIEDDRTYQLEAAVDESRISNVRIGQTARIEIDALRAALDGRVAEIVPASDPTTRTYTVKLDLAPAGIHPANTLRSGFFGKALFPDANRKALLVPESAVIRKGQLDGVYLVQNDVCVFRLVKTGKRDGDRVEILSGLEAGARIVVAPGPGISDGAKIIEAAEGDKTS